MVLVRFSAGVTAYLMSTPTDISWSGLFCSGFPASSGVVPISPTTYGTSSSRFDARPIVTPLNSPNDETNPLAFFDRSGHVVVSFKRATLRITAKPSTPSPPRLKRSWENGMRNSAHQPSLSRRDTTSQTASQLSSLFESLNQYASCLTPTGFTPN